MLKRRLKSILQAAVDETIRSSELPPAREREPEVWRANSAQPFDFASNIAMKIAAAQTRNPDEIAASLLQKLQANNSRECEFSLAAPGFINISIRPPLLAEAVLSIHKQGATFGRSTLGNGSKISVEHPDPLSCLALIDARAVSVGMTLANLLSFAGFNLNEGNGRERAHRIRVGSNRQNARQSDEEELIQIGAVKVADHGMEPRAVDYEDVSAQIGIDAINYIFVEELPQKPITIDLELAKEASRANRVFRLQHAHSSCAARSRALLEPAINVETLQFDPPILNQKDWAAYKIDYTKDIEIYQSLFTQNPQPDEIAKDLIIKLDALPEEVETAAIARYPGRVARFGCDVADYLQNYFANCKFSEPGPGLVKARLGLFLATKQVLANVLGIIGVTAPERM